MSYHRRRRTPSPQPSSSSMWTHPNAVTYPGLDPRRGYDYEAEAYKRPRLELPSLQPQEEGVDQRDPYSSPSPPKDQGIGSFGLSAALPLDLYHSDFSRLNEEQRLLEERQRQLELDMKRLKEQEAKIVAKIPGLRDFVVTKRNQTARVREYINSKCGILEMPRTPDGVFPAAFFHAEAVFIPDPDGNPYGPSIKLSDLMQRKNITLQEAIPFGTDILLDAVEFHCSYINMLAVAVWPKNAEPPTETIRVNKDDCALELESFLSRVDNAGDPPLVYAAVHGVSSPKLQPVSCRIREVLDENYGKIELKFAKNHQRTTHFCFFVLFHREDVYLKDGKRALDIDFFKNKPLREMVREGQQCNVSARSIIQSKGAGIKPSVLELQAIVVSLNADIIPVNGPRATRIRDGPGTFGISKDFSAVFFSESLHYELNRKLVAYFRNFGEYVPDVDPECLKLPPADNFMSSTLSPSPRTYHSFHDQAQIYDPSSFPRNLGNHRMKVEKVLSHGTGILVDSQDERIKCFFSSKQLYCPPGFVKTDLLYPGSRLCANAKLVDERNKIPYLASLVWPEGQVISRDAHENVSNYLPDTIQAYNDVNEIYSEDAPANTSKDNHMSSLRDYQEYLHGTGEVFRILDKNYGLIRYKDCLILFDTCDFWLTPKQTVAKFKKILSEVVQVGDSVSFHASLQRAASKVPYLASSVWCQASPAFADVSQRPTPVLKESINARKIEIFETVVESISPDLPDLRPGANIHPVVESARLDSTISSESSEADYGEITMLFYENASLVGGILEIFKRQTFCFFSKESCEGIKDDLRIHLRVYCLAHKVSEKAFTWAKVVGMVAPVLSHDKALLQAQPGANSDDLIWKLNRIVSSYPNILENPRRPILPVLELTALIKSNTNKTFVQSYGYFKCMLGESCGLLEDHMKKGYFIYFELADINIEESLPITDLALILNKMPGIDVRYSAYSLNDNGPIKYIAYDKGIEILGTLPPHLSDRVTRPRGVVPKAPMSKEKWNRFQEAKERLKRNEIITYEDLLERQQQRWSRERTDEPPRRPEVLDEHTGTVEHFLDDNFGLLRADHINAFCLFDTFDIHLSHGKTAAECQVPIGTVFQLGDKVDFNACLVPNSDGDLKLVPYLATAVWKKGSLPRKIPVMPVSLVQTQKLDIYKQVVASCSGLLKKRETARDKSNDKDFSLDDLDLFDYDCRGTLLEEKDKDFAILKTERGDRVMVTGHRVWLHDKPKFGDWRALHKKYFQLVFISARRVSGFRDFDYQVVYCHSGIRTRKPTGKRKFIYPTEMKYWIKKRSDAKKLDEELQRYKHFFGK